MCEKLAGVGLNAGKAKSHPGRLHGVITQFSGKSTVWTFSLHPFLC